MTEPIPSQPLRLVHAAYAIGTGVLLGAAIGLEPVWWVAWIAPAFLLALAWHAPPRWRTPLAMLATTTATATLLPALTRAMPIAHAVGVILLLALLWAFLATQSCRVRGRFGAAAWTALAFPVLAVATDTLMAHLLPDGNWNGYAYTQADVLPVAQIASVLGIPGVLFVLALVPSAAFHLAETRGRGRGDRTLAVGTVALVVGVVAFGAARLHRADEAPADRVTFGLAAVDDPIGVHASGTYVGTIREAYAQHVATLAAAGARIVVLPEKIAVATPAGAAEWDSAFGALAKRHAVWLVGSVTRDAPDGRANLAWLYAPDGGRVASYQKHHLAPPERDYQPGHAYVVHAIDGDDYGLGICKDLHFASFGREYGRRGVRAMLVPAWDFQVDAELARRMTAMRGIESGYSIVRASRDGLLSISDPYGRTLARTRSGSLPGTELLATVQLPRGDATPYVRIGDAFGALCIAAAIALVVTTRLRRR